jgi:ABC1 atypical kinase-like domain
MNHYTLYLNSRTSMVWTIVQALLFVLHGTCALAWNLRRDVYFTRSAHHRSYRTSLEAAPFTLPPQIASYLEVPANLVIDGFKDVRQGFQNVEMPSLGVLQVDVLKSLPDTSNWKEAMTSKLSGNDPLSFVLGKSDFSFLSASELQEKLVTMIAAFDAVDDELHKHIVTALSDLQSGIVLNYPQLEPLLLSAKDDLNNVSPTLLLVGSILATAAVVNTSLNFGQTPPPSQPYPMNKYDAVSAQAYFQRRPLAVVSRASTIAFQSLQFGFSLFLDSLLNKTYDNEMQRGRELAALLTRLGPTFIKVGQSLSIRTDLLRPAYIRGLEMLQDQVPAFDTATAKRILEAEWGRPISEILSFDLPSQPVAAASLGQVYKARLRATNEEVAIKVQRPNIMEQIALDMYLIREISALLKNILKLNTDTTGTVDAWGTGFVDELDYIQEAANGERFSEQILETPLRDVVFAPTVLKDYTTRSVLATAWVNGERLDRSSSQDVSVVCSIAMNTYLTMLLEFGVLRKFLPLPPEMLFNTCVYLTNQLVSKQPQIVILIPETY